MSRPDVTRSYARLAANTGAALAGRFGSVVLALVLSTVLFRQLGPGQYGVWAFCYVLVGYLTLLDFGLGATVERLLAQAHATHDVARAEQALKVAFTGAAAIALLLQLALLLVPVGLVTSVDLRPVTLVLPLCLFLSFLSTVTGAALSGVQEMARLNVLRTVMNVLSTALVIGLCTGGLRRVEWLLLGHAAGLAGATWLCWREVGRHLGRLRWGFGWSRELAHEFLRFGGQTQAATFGPVLADQAFRLLLGARFGAAMIGFYDLGSRAGIAVRSIAGALLVAMVPFGARLHKTAGHQALQRLYAVGIKYTALFLVPASALALYHSRALVVAWLPGEPGLENVIFVFRTCLVAHALIGLSGPITMVARSAGLPLSEAVIQSLAGVVGLVAGAAAPGADVGIAAFMAAASVGAVLLWVVLSRKMAFVSSGAGRSLGGALAISVGTLAVAALIDRWLVAFGVDATRGLTLVRVAASSGAGLVAGAALARAAGMVSAAGTPSLSGTTE